MINEYGGNTDQTIKDTISNCMSLNCNRQLQKKLSSADEKYLKVILKKRDKIQKRPDTGPSLNPSTV